MKHSLCVEHFSHSSCPGQTKSCIVCICGHLHAINTFVIKNMEHFISTLGSWTINVIKCCFKDFGSSQWMLMIVNSVLDSLNCHFASNFRQTTRCCFATSKSPKESNIAALQCLHSLSSIFSVRIGGGRGHESDQGYCRYAYSKFPIH